MSENKSDVVSFNLIDDPWIPVTWISKDDQKSSLISLQALFERCNEISDLDCAPHERIAFTRLLVCITHSALGTARASEWSAFVDPFPTDVIAYLKRAEVHKQFELLGEGARFLQQAPARPKTETQYPLAKLGFYLVTGNNPKLRDHCGEDPRDWSPAVAARTILSLQNFFIGGSMASKVKGNGPSLKFLHTFVLGSNLKETILKNCLNKETIKRSGVELGKPVWEAPADDSLLARLVPMPCALWLSDDLATTAIDQGYQYLEWDAAQDPFATVIVGKGSTKLKTELRLLRANLNKGVWTDLHAITSQNSADKGDRASSLESYLGNYPDTTETKLWVGELFKAKDAKIIDEIEATFTLPNELFNAQSDASQGLKAHIYKQGIDYADTISRKLYGAIKTYGKAVNHSDQPTAIAEQHYWDYLGARHEALIAVATDPFALRGKPIGSKNANDDWTNLVKEAALNALEYACPRSNPRQLSAYAAARKFMYYALNPKI